MRTLIKSDAPLSLSLSLSFPGSLFGQRIRFMFMCENNDYMRDVT